MTTNSSLHSHVIVIPAYNESDALPLLMNELAYSSLEAGMAVVIVDDSPLEVALETERRCVVAASKSALRLEFLRSSQKGGRGVAVRRGLEHAIVTYPHAAWFLECDADGSHRAADIMAVLNNPETTDLIIGSRYLPSSKIIGWTMSRRVQSRLLNWVIPRLLSVQINDITNGLRRYSRASVTHLLNHQPVSGSFIFLAEQALLVKRGGFSVGEVPIIFAERRGGTSSVSWRELRASLVGLRKIYGLRRRL